MKSHFVGETFIMSFLNRQTLYVNAKNGTFYHHEDLEIIDMYNEKDSYIIIKYSVYQLQCIMHTRTHVFS